MLYFGNEVEDKRNNIMVHVLHKVHNRRKYHTRMKQHIEVLCSRKQYLDIKSRLGIKCNSLKDEIRDSMMDVSAPVRLLQREISR